MARIFGLHRLEEFNGIAEAAKLRSKESGN